MPEKQYLIAQKIFPILVDAARNHRTLTYPALALLLGRPADNARTIAQACDLLDAAAAHAGVPLLALIKITESSGYINRKAWTRDTPDWVRNAIISKSLRHDFVASDFDAIKGALDTLGRTSNRAAWKQFFQRYTGELVYEALAGPRDEMRYSDAINDLGSDHPERKNVQVSTYTRDPAVRDAVIRRAQGRCEYCGALGFISAQGERFLETHHIIALAKDGADRITNVIALCANDHRKAHFSADRDEIEKKMISIVRKKVCF